MPIQVDTFVDSDWAGCKATARSTSGGAARLGWHPVKTWSTTQTVVAMSSGEAELYSLTKGAAQTLGLISLGRDLGIQLSGLLHTDASATLGIVSREGLGKLRHVQVQYLWIQDRIRGGDLCASKIPGQQNPADLMTKYLAGADILRHTEELGYTLHDNRAEIAPQLSRVSTIDHDNHDDCWKEETETCVTREHRRPRMRLFTPLRVTGAPNAQALTATRITRGDVL